jgi:23S rRNA (cytidine1920-2'-O)/16S rRNA (cytidine1409-2'-O)-methyltransferase
MSSSPSRDRTRLDDALVQRQLAESRSRAQALILAGDALVNGSPVMKAGALVRHEDELAIKAPPRFVSRGGEKLDKALDAFGMDVAGAVVADFGASTGGFTDCVLQRGASRVYAIDVGYGQLAERVRTDPRVVVIDRTNVRHVESLPEPVQLVVIDVSFIGLKLVLPAAKSVLDNGGEIVALVKPQFEAGKGQVGKGGVVRDPAIHRRVLEEMFQHAADLDLGVVSLIPSPIRGPAGNVEFLVHLRPDAASIQRDQAIECVIASAAGGDAP